MCSGSSVFAGRNLHLGKAYTYNQTDRFTIRFTYMLEKFPDKWFCFLVFHNFRKVIHQNPKFHNMTPQPKLSSASVICRRDPKVLNGSSAPFSAGPATRASLKISQLLLGLLFKLQPLSSEQPGEKWDDATSLM